jgi:hypothetical protein
MDYFFYNTDSNKIFEQPRPRFPLLIKQGFAAVGGGQKYGEKLGQLTPDDILLMYENGIGVVAVGKVRKHWDAASHTVPMYFTPTEMGGLTGGAYEYRIEVEWFLDLSSSPISLDRLRERFGYKTNATVTRGTINKRVKQRTEIAQIIEEVRAELSLLPGEIAHPSL